MCRRTWRQTLAARCLPQEDVISAPEVAGDVSKWVVYDVAIGVLQDALPAHEPQLAAAYFTVGALSAVVGLAVSRKVAQDEAAVKARDGLTDGAAETGAPGVRASAFGVAGAVGAVLPPLQAALEGGVLFMTYEEYERLAAAVIPADIGTAQFPFARFVERVGGFSQEQLLQILLRLDHLSST